MSFTEIAPKDFTFGDLEAVIERAEKRAAKNTLRSFRTTVQTWSKKNRPKFVVQRITSTKDGVRIEVVATGEAARIYGYVSRGTQPHIIRAKKSPFLAFREGYVAKTKPGRIGAQAGGSFGGHVRKQEVKHPGNEGRKFEEQIAKREKKRFDRALLREIQLEVEKRNRE